MRQGRRREGAGLTHPSPVGCCRMDWGTKAPLRRGLCFCGFEKAFVRIAGASANEKLTSARSCGDGRVPSPLMGEGQGGGESDGALIQSLDADEPIAVPRGRLAARSAAKRQGGGENKERGNEGRPRNEPGSFLLGVPKHQLRYPLPSTRSSWRMSAGHSSPASMKPPGPYILSP